MKYFYFAEGPPLKMTAVATCFLIVLLLSMTATARELKPIVSPETMAKKLIKRGAIESWVRIGKVDIDRDGDVDKVMASDYSDSGGNTLWRVYFNEKGKYYHIYDGVFSARSDMMGAGKLQEFNENWGIVSYSKASASTGTVHGAWFEKINGKEVKKHEKEFFRVNVGHKSETREEDKAKIDGIFSRADEDVFDEVKHYTVEEFVEEHGLEVDEDAENSSESENESEPETSEPQSREEADKKESYENGSNKDSDSE